MIVSFVLPVFNCEGNIKPLFEEFKQMAAKYPMFQPEYIFVDDASTDGSMAELESLDSQFLKIVGLKENIGSYKAAIRGMEHATGGRIVVMAADGQDDPEVAYNLVGLCDNSSMSAAYRKGSANGLFAKLYHRIISRLSAPYGSGRVFDIVVFPSDKVPIITLDPRCQAHLFYGLDAMFKSKMMFEHTKRKRKIGKSGWTLNKKLHLALDSIIAFSRNR